MKQVNYEINAPSGTLLLQKVPDAVYCIIFLCGLLQNSLTLKINRLSVCLPVFPYRRWIMNYGSVSIKQGMSLCVLSVLYCIHLRGNIFSSVYRSIQNRPVWFCPHSIIINAPGTLLQATNHAAVMSWSLAEVQSSLKRGLKDTGTVSRLPLISSCSFSPLHAIKARHVVLSPIIFEAVKFKSAFSLSHPRDLNQPRPGQLKPTLRSEVVEVVLHRAPFLTSASVLAPAWSLIFHAENT